VTTRAIVSPVARAIEFRVGLVLDQAAHAADDFELRDARHLRFDRRPALEPQ